MQQSRLDKTLAEVCKESLLAKRKADAIKFQEEQIAKQRAKASGGSSSSSGSQTQPRQPFAAAGSSSASSSGPLGQGAEPKASEKAASKPKSPVPQDSSLDLHSLGGFTLATGVATWDVDFG